VPSFDVSFPPPLGARPDEELIDVTFGDGRTERMGLHDYDRVFAVPGLYEEVVQHRLDCRSPERIAALLATAALGLGWPPGDVRVLDVGAGNGVSGAALAAAGLRPVVGIDILPAARAAVARDRPGLYALYLAADLLALDAEAEAAIRALAPNALTLVGAVGSDHLPAEALAAALDLVCDEALLAYTFPRATEGETEIGAVLALLEKRRRGGALKVLAREPYRHRLTTDGRERWWVAVVARVSRRPPR